MFGKKCPSCNSKIEKKFYFCPYCGTNIMKENESQDFGILGDDDRISMPNLNLGQMGLDKIFNGLIKQLSQEIGQVKDISKSEKEVDKTEIPKNARGISISISTANGKKPEIKISGMGQNIPQEKAVKIEPHVMSEDKARMISKLPRVEAEAKVRRLSNRVIYEIELPEIENKSDILINQLENSLEIKAFAKNKVYHKILPVNMPILKYELENGKLFLELKSA